MAEQSVKREPGLVPQLLCNPFTPASPISESDRIDPSGPLWKVCDGRTPGDQVRINEDAASNSSLFFEHAEKILNKFVVPIPSCGTRLKDIAGIKNRKKTAEVRIGFLGGSGTGKSSLINSLLKMKVLPKSHEIASTAVPVEVAYNNDDDPDHRFRAVIEGISSVEFKKEIEELFQFKELYDMGPEEGDGENDEFDDTMYQEMLTTFAKIKWIYPTLKNIDDLGKTSAATLLKEPHVVEILDSVQSVTAKTELAFAEQIKQYIESSKPKEGEKRLISLWPLVKVVRIYVRAQILKPGIVLVDLPGSQDTSASRVAVTDNYRKNLSASVVCAPAIRAASDKIAHDLLSSVERRNMQMDGLYTSESLFFTVTKIDELIDHKDYIRTHSTELRKLTQEDMENISICQEQVKKLERDLKNRAAKKGKAEVVLEKMKLAYANLKSRVEQTFEAQTLAGHKRKHMVDITESEAAHLNENERANIKKLRDLKEKMADKLNWIQKEGNELYQMEQQKSYLQTERLQAKSRVMKVCINNRAQMHVIAAREEYESARKMMGKQPSEKPLRVFSVSANAFDLICSGEQHEVQKALENGFTNKIETGIPALRDALMAITWGTRLSNARMFNEEVEICLAVMKTWSADSAPEYMMAANKRALVESRMDAEIMKLEEAFKELHSKTPQKVEKLIEDGIYKQFDKTAQIARKNAYKTVIYDWTTVAWNTHRAINRHGGMWKGSNRRVYDWNEDLTGLYLQALMKDWTETFHNYRLELLQKYEAQVDQLISDFVEPLLTSAHDIHPGIDEALKSLKDNVLCLRNMLKDSAGDIFESINEAAKESHRAVKPQIESCWQFTYIKCGEEKGTGLYERNKQRHREHVKAGGGVRMYEKAEGAMRETMRPALKKLPEKFKASFEEAIAKLREDLKVTLDLHSVSNTPAIARTTSAARTKLHKALKPHFEKLGKSWGIAPEPEIDDIDQIQPETLDNIGDSDIDDFKAEDFE